MPRDRKNDWEVRQRQLLAERAAHDFLQAALPGIEEQLAKHLQAVLARSPAMGAQPEKRAVIEKRLDEVVSRGRSLDGDALRRMGKIELHQRQLRNEIEEVLDSVPTDGKNYSSAHDVRDSLKALRDKIKIAGYRIQLDEGFPCWVKDVATGETAEGHEGRRLLRRAIETIDYKDDQHPSEVQRFIGISAASKETIGALVELNRAKEDFSLVITSFRRGTRTKDWEDELGRYFERERDRSALIRSLLSHYSGARVNVRQATREANLLHTRPDSVAFTWQTESRSIREISNDAAKKMIQSNALRRESVSDEARAADLEAIQGHEKLYVVWYNKPHPRANLVWGSGELVMRKSFIASIPFFYPMGTDRSLPVLRPGPDGPDDVLDREQRRDRSIGDEPITRTLKLYVRVPPEKPSGARPNGFDPEDSGPADF